ncbi:MAG: type II toxin-antitoxin system HicA family toxin [Elusimicrobia bacterium]|nr:type II toxin-antitoxin system HicA family toxin [Elusimicrobiota bacterium]
MPGAALKLPRLTADQLIRAISKAGFSEIRQSGSHKIFKNAEGKRITVPYHKGKTLHPKLVQAAIHDTGLSLEEFLGLL